MIDRVAETRLWLSSETQVRMAIHSRQKGKSIRNLPFWPVQLEGAESIECTLEKSGEKAASAFIARWEEKVLKGRDYGNWLMGVISLIVRPLSILGPRLEVKMYDRRRSWGGGEDYGMWPISRKWKSDYWSCEEEEGYGNTLLLEEESDYWDTRMNRGYIGSDRYFRFS